MQSIVLNTRADCAWEFAFCNGLLERRPSRKLSP
jgi:hypothetical protein